MAIQEVDGLQMSEPEDPKEWPSLRKWVNLGLTSLQAALTPIAATILAVGNEAVANDYELVDAYSANLPVALFLLGNGLGPLYLAPLSELHGRRIVYLISFAIFAVLNVGCALSNSIVVLTVLRFFAGMAGSVASTLGGASVGDMFCPAERGLAQSIYGFMPMLGPVLGGILGGFIISGTGSWRWCMWVMFIASTICVIACYFLLRETYAPFITRRYQHQHGIQHIDEKIDVGALFSRAISRPLRLFASPICAIMSIYTGFAYGVFYFHLVTLSLLFGTQPVEGLFSYQWPSGLSGLSYLGVGIGSIIGVLVTAKCANHLYSRGVKRIRSKEPSLDNEEQKSPHDPKQRVYPEARLPFLMIAMAVAPVGLIIYAWTTEYHVPWIVPLLGAAIFATGVIMAYIYIQVYLVDVFGEYAASAIATCSLLRSFFACTLSIVGVDAYQRLGYGWGTMLLSLILVGMQPIPILLYVYGPRLRTHGPAI